MGTTKAKMKETILGELGLSGRAVELRDPDIDRAVTAALRKIAHAHPQLDYTSIPISVSVQKYLLNVPNIVGVRDVAFYNNGGRFTAYPYPDAAIDHRLIMSQMKVQEKEYGDWPAWDFNIEADGPSGSETEKGYLYIYFNSDSFLDRAGRIPNYVSVEYLWALEYSDDKLKGLPRVRPDWQDWVDNYSIAIARRILGGIRNKFKGIPGPDGQPMGIDGDALIEQGTREKKELEEDLQQRSRQLPPIIY